MAETGPGTFAALLVVALLIPGLSIVFPNLQEALTADVVVGIDLGTTYSVVATCTKKVVSVHNIDGHETLPSVVYFNTSAVPSWSSAKTIPPGSVTVGTSAHDLKDVFPRNVVYASKRLIGLEYNSSVVRQEREALQYAVAQDEEGRAVPTVEGRHIPPEEIASWLLRRLKAAAQGGGSPLRRLLGFKFKGVTVSVPVSFSQEQKAATIRAANRAGFSFVRLIEEPVAAAIAYELNKHEGDRIVLVFDFGGGTLDVALLRLDPEQGAFLVMDRAGDPHLGGEDFDNMLADHFAALLQRATGADSSTMAGVRPALLQSVERAKRELSREERTRIDLPQGTALGGELPELHLSRGDIEAVCRPLLNRARAPLEQALAQMNLQPDDISDVVMVGGSSRLEAVRKMVSEFFGGKKLNTDINPDTAIAIGAARSFGC
uniref:Glucose-regulated protein n=1 Tax=Tetraselmis sp. GSL018 TaxID=582737 RepID=A0A061S952_9CHLO|mmetsp:Transcript_1306/g.3106  ORF Transcript_1306/g.3106 Transcript_1306/m.3106 type:complete len:432 (-) Transcript_1306:148-1443(-)|eukprot:CAMPEP_0177599526 /NCGR_PEP_ID=MMETSP0419_2-20121207/13047_1 /TAXON_ID=582737 /ORGANISM="Tetraselmis sp., Strain GSL018" /LENGTH=431 /DNA_ID=CAMNT_0019092279 /DNA_START=214 /DNA_END=1509 /DNA_ORIENTATION=-